MMDIEKCRTCFTNLERSDLYQKLDMKYKNSSLSLVEKLRICVPIMDLKDVDNVYICMQCTMHLETAYTFHTTCLEAEEKFQEYLSQTSKVESCNRRSTRSGNVGEETKEKVEMSCHTCNIRFSTKNILDLHIRVMHMKDELGKNYDNAEVAGFRKEIRGKDDKLQFQMVFVQDDKEMSSKKECITENTKIDKIESEKRNTRRRLPRRDYSEATELLIFTKEKDLNADASLTDVDMSKSRKRKRGSNEIEDIKPDIRELSIGRNGNNWKEYQKKKMPDGDKLINCRFCSKSLLTKALTQHIAQAHKDRCNQCLLCNRYYTNMKKHRKVYGCQLQNLSKATNSDFVKIESKPGRGNTVYYITTPKQGIHMCIICRRKCHGINDLENHILAKHSTCTQCKICLKRFTGIRYCSHVGHGCHKLTEGAYVKPTPDGVYICPLCKTCLPNKAEWRAHLSCHLFNRFECVYCKKPFSLITKYCAHLFKDCPRAKSKKESVHKETVFVTETNHDLLFDEDEYSSPSQELYVKNVKVEPTELLAQDGFIHDEGFGEKDSLDISQINGESTSASSSEDVADQPDLIYVLPNQTMET